MREWLEQEAESRRLEAHVRTAARDWDGGGRVDADLYRGPRLAAVLDWQTGHAQELGGLEEEFIAASRNESERELEAQKQRNRRLRILAAGTFGSAGARARGGRRSARATRHGPQAARDALARQLGAEALTEPRIDTAMLLAREAVNLSPSTQTESTLFATLLRSPGALATFTSPITSRPQRLSVSPDGRTAGGRRQQRRHALLRSRTASAPRRRRPARFRSAADLHSRTARSSSRLPACPTPS